MYGDIIIFLYFICCISPNIFHSLYFPAFHSILNPVRVLPPPPPPPPHPNAGERQSQRPRGTDRDICFGSSMGAGGNTDLLFISVWFLASYSIFYHYLCMRFAFISKCIFKREAWKLNEEEKDISAVLRLRFYTHKSPWAELCKTHWFHFPERATRFAVAQDPAQPAPQARAELRHHLNVDLIRVS